MVDHMNMSNGQLHWDTNFMRTMHDWELEPLSSFLCLLYSNILRRAGEDKFVSSHPKAMHLRFKCIINFWGGRQIKKCNINFW